MTVDLFRGFELERNHSYEHVMVNGYRHYKIAMEQGEAIFPGVTSILQVIAKPHLVDWSAREACRYLEWHLPPGEALNEHRKADLLRQAATEHQRRVAEACAIGTEAHALIEERLRSGTVPDLKHAGPSVRSCVLRFHRWWSSQDWECVASEKLVYSKRWGFAGLLDCLARASDGTLAVFDWKTSRFHSHEFALQAIAYKLALEEMLDLTVDRVFVVRIGKLENSIEVRQVPTSEHQALAEVFLAAKRLWDWKSALPSPTGRPVGSSSPGKSTGAAPR